MKPITDYRIRIIGILTLTLINFGFSSSGAMAGLVPGSLKLYVSNFLIGLIPSIALWECVRLLVVFYNRKYTLGIINAKRIGREALLVVAVSMLVYTVLLPVIIFTDDTNPPVLFLAYGAVDRALYGLIVGALYELFFFMEALKTERQEKEELRKLNLSMQLESLKSQVKPHFLFNSLNTLTALVEQDTQKAVKFIAELSKVYRYLLQSNEKEMIVLEQELDFTRAYFYLLQMRFGDGISMNISVPQAAQQAGIPPLTLQMLVENAVKHNQVSTRKPLHITICIENEQWIVVQNNMQLKRHMHSNGMGLSNIAAKFRLLNQEGLQIINDDVFFTIKVPLIKPSEL